MRLRLDPGSREPIYRQLLGQLKRGIALGLVRPGDQLPSVRDLAHQQVINPNTILKVYGELEHEGLVRSRRGIGTFVVRSPERLSRAERERIVGGLLESALIEASNLGLGPDEVHRLLAARAGRYGPRRGAADG